jgi:hypothetical protein
LQVTGVDARAQWFYVDLSADGATWQNGTVLVGMGRIIAMSGQSQAVRQLGKMPSYSGTNASLNVSIEPKSAVYARYTDSARSVTTPVWAVPADASNYDSTFVAEFLRRQVADRGVNCAIVGHAVGSTAIASWQPGQQNNADLRTVLDAVGGFEAFYWHQGGDDAGAGTTAAAYQAGLSGVFGDLAAHNVARGNSFERYVTAMATRTSAGAGGTAAVQTVRKAAFDWSGANGATYLEPHDVNLEDAVHQGQPGSITLARHLHRAMSAANDNGPTITGATRVATAITLATSAALALVGNPANRFTVYAAGTTATPLAISSVAISGSSITLTLAEDPGSGQALDVYWLRHPDPSGTTAAANMIYDTFTADGLPAGRQLQPTVAAPITVAAVGGGQAPATAFLDGYNDTDGANLTAHTSNSGHSYTAVIGSIVIAGNEAYGTTSGGTGTAYLSNFIPASADYTVKATFKCLTVVAGIGAWVLGRASTSGTTRTHYQAGYQKAGTSGEGIYLGKTVAGQFNPMGFFAYVLEAGASPEIGLVMSGTSISATLNGSVVIAPVTDESIKPAGTIGLRTVNVSSATTGIHFDNLAA